MKRTVPLVTGFALLVSLWPRPSFAQFNGHNTKGDYGLQSASQPPPGWYLLAPLYLRYHTDTLKNSEGVPVLPDERDSLDVNAFVGGLIYVSEDKLLGGHYSFQAYPAWTDSNLEVPIFGVDQQTSVAFADFYFQPLNLGWHTPRADFTVGFGVYAPTGRYTPGADDNVGLGMWGFEPFGGATLYFDEAQRWHFAATAFYATHSEKKDTDVRVGDVLTIEGGLGWSFLEGAANVGVAYIAQWKVTDDDLGSFDVDGLLEEAGLPPVAELPIGKHRAFGVGPELTLPIATKTKLIAILNARYIFEFGARTALEGNTFVISATFPIPSVSLQ
jgi:hypothetical protein